MVEPILIAAICGVCFMLGRCYQEFRDIIIIRGDGIGDVI